MQRIDHQENLLMISKLDSFNNTEHPYSYHKVICDFFESCVERFPEKTAVIGVNDSLSYRELNRKSNQLARKLRAMGVKPDSIVGIMTERSCEMFVGLFAILKAGAAYLPIDPNNPTHRNKLIIEDSDLKIILVQSPYNSPALKSFVETIDLNNNELYEGAVSNLQCLTSPNDLAYVIYTSGSTGNPKGVLIENHSLINRLEWMQNAYPITTSDVLVQKTPYTFDVSVWELFWWTMIGSSVCLLPKGKEFDPRALVKLIEKHSISVLHFVPSVLRIFLDYIESDFEVKRIKSLKWVFSSGEALSNRLVNRFNTIFRNEKAQLINLYGPTEATVDVSHFPCKKNIVYENVPIGTPIQNTQFYIVNDDQELQPIGEIGELLISGAGISRGYLNNPKLTRERFIYKPEISNKVMYRTGDYAKWNEKGEVQFLGRMDDQVKLRGLRIELGEIEFYISRFKGVKDCVVIVKKAENNEQYLLAFIIPDQNQIQGETEKLKTFLKKHLPLYMIPNRFIYLDEFPLKSNGKIDRKRLIEEN